MRQPPRNYRQVAALKSVLLCMALAGLEGACKSNQIASGTQPVNARSGSQPPSSESIRPVQDLRGHWFGVRCLAFSPDSKVLATGSLDYTVKLWDTATWQVKRTLRLADSVNSVAFSPDGKILAIAARNVITMWDPATGKQIGALPQRGGHVLFSQDGRMLATMDVDWGLVRLWRTATWQPIYTLNNVRGESLTFSPDNKILAIGGLNRVELSDAAHRRRLRVLQGRWGPSARNPQGWVKSMAFSPNGRILATCGEDSKVWLWDTARWKEIRALGTVGSRPDIYSVAFSIDSKWVAGACSDGMTRLWNAVTGEEAFKLSGHREWVLCVAFSPDGKWLVSGSYDATAKVWNAPVPVANTSAGRR